VILSLGSTNNRAGAIRMEDVVYTLNNIMDDIGQMYADSASAVDSIPLEDVSYVSFSTS
jgi:hypothetical protein